MISALSQKQQATVHAGKQQKNVQQAPPSAQQQAATGTPDDSNATLPQPPDGSQQQVPVIRESKPWWQKALPFVAAGVVGVAGAVFCLHGVGNKVHTEKIQSHLAEIFKPESEYRKNFFDPRAEIYQKYDKHLKDNPGISEPEKENLAKFLNNLLISEKGDIADLHHIPLGDNDKAYSIPLHTEALKEANDDFKKDDHLPRAFKDAIQETFNKLSDEFAKHEEKIIPSDRRTPSLLIKTLWNQEHPADSIKPHISKLSTIETGFTVLQRMAGGFVNRMIKGGEKELTGEKLDPQKDDRRPITINID